MNRRDFLGKSAKYTLATTAGLSLWGAKPRWAGAADRVRVGVVGIRGMGFGHIRSFSELENVEVTALCDVDERLFPERLQWLENNGHPTPDTYVDIRKMLDDRNIDAIGVATPNHWHSLAGFWAAQAGVHSTLEKPATHNIFEGQQLIKAADRYNVLIQQHAERRSFPGFQSAAEFLRNGGLGEVYLAKGLCYKWRDTIGHTPVEPVPEGVHYDLWLGPAPRRPFTRNRFHYEWHWHWEYGNGDIGNQGVHQMDIARWLLGVDFPTKISSMGGHFMFNDDKETPNTQMALFEFSNPDGGGDKKKMMQFEVRHWITHHEGGVEGPGDFTIGNLFYGSEGYMSISLNGDWQTYMGRDREPGPSGSGRGNMFQNFVDAIRANDRSMLDGDIVEGHKSCALMHMANTSYRLGRTLNFDPATERYIDDDEANAMMTRDYREPFVIPGNF